MNDLYDQVFTGRPPVIDGLLYSGTYLLAGAPKVGKSFLVAQLAYHVSTGRTLWEYPVIRAGCSIWRWRMTNSACKSVCPGCSA